jgi:hypothetical protein
MSDGSFMMSPHQTKYYLGDQTNIKSCKGHAARMGESGGACGVWVGKFGGKEIHMEELDLDSRILLKMELQD